MKRYISLLLAVLLIVGVLSACGENETTTTTTAAATTAATTAGESEEDGLYSLPIVDDTITFSAMTWFRSTVMDDWNECEAFQELERRTNVHIDFIGWSSDNRTEKFNLMVNSQDYPDLLNFFNSDYIGGYDSYVSNDVIIDLADLIAEYAPRYSALREENPDVAKDTVTDTGIMPAFFLIQQIPQPRWFGPVVRQDMLNEIGYDVSTVETYDDYHDMLTALKDSGLCKEAPFGMYTGSGIANWLASGFNAYNGFLNIDGTAVYSTATDEMKEYVATVRSWYSEGLIDKYFYSRGDVGDQGMAPEDSQILNDNYGLYNCSYTKIDMNEMQGIAENYEITPIPTPVKNSGDVNRVYYTGSDHKTVNKSMAVSTACSEPEIAVRYLDYCYDEDMATVLMYGLEGSGRVTIDGQPFFSEEQLADPDGVNGNSYSVLAMWPTLYMWTREFTLNTSDKVYDSIYEVWNREIEGDSYFMPPVTLTTEESTTYANIMSEVNTYAAEQIVRIVIGEKDLEAGWQEFLTTIDNMGIDDAIEIQQAALDRYNAR